MFRSELTIAHERIFQFSHRKGGLAWTELYKQIEMLYLFEKNSKHFSSTSSEHKIINIFQIKRNMGKFPKLISIN